MRHIEIERCTKTEKCMGTDARRHSSFGKRELAETNIDNDTERQRDRQTYDSNLTPAN